MREPPRSLSLSLQRPIRRCCLGISSMAPYYKEMCLMLASSARQLCRDRVDLSEAPNHALNFLPNPPRRDEESSSHRPCRPSASLNANARRKLRGARGTTAVTEVVRLLPWLLTSPSLAPPRGLLTGISYRAHIIERGISPMTVMDFQMGYSPADLTSPLIEYLDQVLLVWVVVAAAVDVAAWPLFCYCLVLGWDSSTAVV